LIIIASITIALLEFPSWRLALLFALVIWASARLYYFMFYVIEKYIDPQYKFAGVGSFIMYMISSRKKPDLSTDLSTDPSTGVTDEST